MVVQSPLFSVCDEKVMPCDADTVKVVAHGLPSAKALTLCRFDSLDRLRVRLSLSAMATT